MASLDFLLEHKKVESPFTILSLAAWDNFLLGNFFAPTLYYYHDLMTFAS
jgi:hypothetical protein